jgi:hypothetical protein
MACACAAAVSGLRGLAGGKEAHGSPAGRGRSFRYRAYEAGEVDPQAAPATGQLRFRAAGARGAARADHRRYLNLRWCDDYAPGFRLPRGRGRAFERPAGSPLMRFVASGKAAAERARAGRDASKCLAGIFVSHLNHLRRVGFCLLFGITRFSTLRLQLSGNCLTATH